MDFRPATRVVFQGRPRSRIRGIFIIGLYLLFCTLVVPTIAFAQVSSGGAKPSEGLLFTQIIILIFCGRLLGELMQRVGQPAVIGQLVAGLLLGPSVLGLLWPGVEQMLFPKNPTQTAMLNGIAQVGILFLLLLTGMETDLKLVRKVGKPAISISLMGILIPFALGVGAGQFIPDSLLPHPEARLITSLFLGTALSISSVKVVAMVVREMKFMRRNVGQIVVSAAIVDDTIGWIIIAITFSLAQSGTIEPWQLAKSILGTALFLAFSLTIGRRIVFSLIRWANDHFVSEVAVISTIVVIMGVMALITEEIGVHTVLGAFVAGVLVGESPILTRQIDGQLRGMITGFFAPVFFGLAGLSADLTILKDWNLFLLTLALIAIASVGKFAGAFVGGKLGGLKGSESFALASGMNARGSTEVIVATIGLSLGILSENLFTMIVTMAVVTTMAMPPMLRFALSRLPLGEEERKRLEREEYEAKGFVSNLERLLLAVDESKNGQFTSRLAGYIAGSRGMPTTVFHLDKSRKPEAAKVAKAKSSASAVAYAAKKSKTTVSKSKGEIKDEPDPVDVTARVQNAPTRKAIEDEAKRGYDLLFIGVDKAVNAEGIFRNEVSRIAAGFSGPLAVVTARGRHTDNPVNSPLNILVAIAGTGASRRAAEVAVALARGSRGRLVALYVSDSPASKQERRSRRASATHQQEEAVLKEVAEIADRYSTPIRTAVRVNIVADVAILKEAQAGRYDLIIMGASRRAGEKLFFGNTAQAVLERAKCSVMFITDPFMPQQLQNWER
jgi:Kef-type K+ transport system membrane component KefB/nucleotide-binding universal stress UspA family protein